jgi:hypothetical protein
VPDFVSELVDFWLSSSTLSGFGLVCADANLHTHVTMQFLMMAKYLIVTGMVLVPGRDMPFVEGRSLVEDPDSTLKTSPVFP